MRTIFAWLVGTIVCFLAGLARAEQGIQWQSDLDTARQVAASTNRLVLMHFSATWCHWCKPLEKNVFGQPEVAQAIEAYYVPVRMDYDQHRQIAKQYSVQGVPWDVIITPDGSWVADFNSPQTAEKYASRVTQVANREAAKTNAMLASQQTPSRPSGRGYENSAPPSNPPDPYAHQDYRKAKPADRYTDFYNNRQPTNPQVDPVNPPYGQQVAPDAAGPGWDFGTSANPPAPGIATPAPLGQPTFALDGFCPVHLHEQGKWVEGDRRWGANHRGKTYLFLTKSCQEKFLADPDRYAPALSGNDPVALVDRGQTVPGRREVGCFFGPNRRIVLFADEASYQAFERNQKRYEAQIFASPQ